MSAKLKTETNNDETGAEVRQAFAWWIEEQGYEPETMECFFEHGHWWARATFDDDDQPERTWNVVDAQTAVGEDYLDFEEV